MIPISDDQPHQRFPVVTLIIIVLNVLVFAGWQLQVGLPASVDQAAFIPADLTEYSGTGAIPTLFTAMFMHGGWMHLIGNMWFLWIFGNNIEDACGHGRFIVFYLLTGVLATLAHVAADPASTVPLVGASGAVSGVLGAYLVKHPRAQVRTLIPLGIFTRLVDVPAFLFLLIWIGLQIFWQVSKQQGGVAYLAHIGGFIAGVVLIFLLQLPARKRPWNQSSWETEKYR